MHHRFPWVLNIVGALAVSGSGAPVFAHAQVAPVHLDEAGKATHGRIEARPVQQKQARDQAALVTLSVSDSSLRYVVQTLAAQAGLKVFYDIDNPVFAKRVSLRVREMNVVDAINSALKGTGLSAKLTADRQTVMIGEAQGQKSPNADSVTSKGTITGLVFDSATNQPLSGVSVSVQGTRLGAVTGDNGRFVITNVPVGERVISVRLLGYTSVHRTIPVTVERQGQLRIGLVAKTTQLSEVVTSVTGQQRKIEIGNDITTINVDSVMKTAPITTVTDLLETRVPGLTVMRSSGMPGAPSRLRLRGISGGMLSSEMNGPTNDPIIVVDGIRIRSTQSGAADQNLTAGPYPAVSAIDQIDPNSIEKIEVLKGPSAAALYGSDAANGVIVITTKRGQEGPMRWRANLSHELEYTPGSYPTGFYPYCTPISGSGTGGTPTLCTLTNFTRSMLDSVVHFQALNVPRLTPVGTGNGSSITVNVSGGTRGFTYSVTGSVDERIGGLKMPLFYQDLYKRTYDSAPPPWMKRPNELKQWAFTAAFAFDPRKDLRTTITTRLTNTNQRQTSGQYQLSTLATTHIDTASIGVASLIDYAERSLSKSFVSDMVIATDVNVLSYFPMTATIGFSRQNREDMRVQPYGMSRGGSSVDDGHYGMGSEFSDTRSGRLNGTLFPGRLVSMAMGTDINMPLRKRLTAKLDSLQPGILTPATLTNATQSSMRTATGGWFVEPRLNLNSRFFVNPGFRFDGNSASGRRSGTSGIWSLFPRLNFSYVAIDRQETTPLFGFITLFRPRVSFGIAGVQPAPEWQLRLLRVPGGDISTIDIYGLELRTIGNTQLRAERTREIEGGFDLDLWDGRASLMITQFRKMRKDAIERIGVAPSVYGDPALYQYRNIGRVRNTGTEFSVNATVVEHPIVRWTVNMSISKYDNRLLTLNSDVVQFDIGDDGTRLVAGYPLYGRWARPLLGYWLSDPSGRLSKSDIIIGDTAVYMGQQTPNFELPFSTAVTLFRGRINVSATFQYKDGMTQFNKGNELALANIYFNPNATLADQAAALGACTGLFRDNCTDYGLIQTVNSLRFNALSLGYNVPTSFARRLHVGSLSVAVQGRNLGLWTSYRGKDPDVNSVTIGDSAMDTGVLPQQRMWRLQISVGN